MIGDPSARFGTHTPLTYKTIGEIAQPLWKDIFHHILKECSYLSAFNTVYVMVDTRNLKAHGTVQDGLPHWPAAVAWWHSKIQLVGPHKEKTELLFFPANEGNWPASCASNLGWYICSSYAGGNVSWHQFHFIGQ